MRKTLKLISLLISATAILALISYATILYAFPFPYEKLTNIQYSKSIYDKDHNMLRAFTNTKDQWLVPITLDEINPNLINATLAIEDKRFFKHPGVDAGAILRAIELNISNRRIISGASTITMQAVRLLNRRDRSIKNKIIEAMHAIYLDMIYTKEEILKLYLEIAPYGGNIHGVKAASMRYFKKHPKDLSLSECALLAGLPQSPSRLRPDRYPDRAKKRRGMVLEAMLKNKFIAQAEHDTAKDSPVIAGNYSFPFKAPHFTRFIKNKFKSQSNIITTLDSNTQHFAKTILREKVNQLKPYDVTNGAIVVIENKTGDVKAMVGSADFFSNEDSGQINGTLSRRCPGSTLKPFTYALAFEKGLLAPDAILNDSPIQYNGYIPLDYDKEYRGEVTAKQALIDSLNIPAVEALNKVGYNNLYYLLERLGISTLNKSPGYYGLSLTLGSCEVKLLELTNAYACLARLGTYKPTSLRGGKADAAIPKQILSQSTCYQIADILSDTKRLKAIGIHRGEKLHPKIAFKTGTSYDHKDAWTISYNPEYTIGVWLGNFSGRSSRALVGIEAATPVAVRLFDWLYTNKIAPWYTEPPVILQKKGFNNVILRDRQRPKDLVLQSPKILSPASGCEYFITNLGKENQQLSLIGNAGSDSIYWFIDGKFYGKIKPTEKLFWPMEKGPHHITCSDPFGQSSTVRIIVR